VALTDPTPPVPLSPSSSSSSSLSSCHLTSVPSCTTITIATVGRLRLLRKPRFILNLRQEARRSNERAPCSSLLALQQHPSSYHFHQRTVLHTPMTHHSSTTTAYPESLRFPQVLSHNIISLTNLLPDGSRQKPTRRLQKSICNRQTSRHPRPGIPPPQPPLSERLLLRPYSTTP